MSRKSVLAAVVLLLVIAGAAGLYLSGGPLKSHPPIPVGADGSLLEHGRLFRKGVEKVTDGVYVAIGYGIANSIMVEGKDGLIIVDTMTTLEEATEVLAEFRKISSKPIRAVIYTHSHPDHVLGAEVFTAEGRPDVYAHETTAHHVTRLLTEIGPVIGMRSLRMYGNFLSPGQVPNVGIGPFVGMKPESRLGYVTPTRTFSDTLEDEVAGVRFKLIFAPGETDDQIVVWLPDRKVLIPADNFYWAFPNLYTIRGTTFRSLKNWYRSLDRMRELKPEYLVPCHTRPIRGAAQIERALTDYRDAIQFVHDQAIRGMNMGLTPHELAESVKLPPHLAEAPYLQPFYGKVSWSVRSMFDGNLGWFSGDSADLQPLSLRKQAELMARLAGGEAGLLKHGRELLTQGEFQAALQLSGHLVRLNPLNQEAKDIRVKALAALGEREQNPNARHYYLTEAIEVRDGFVAVSGAKPSPGSLRALPLKNFFESLAVNLSPEASAQVNQTVGMVFPDANQAFTIHVRYGVAEIRERTAEELDRLDLSIKVVADSQSWKEVLAKVRNPLTTLAGFGYPKGNAIAFGRFMALFAPPKPKLPYAPMG